MSILLFYVKLHQASHFRIKEGRENSQWPFFNCLSFIIRSFEGAYIYILQTEGESCCLYNTQAQPHKCLCLFLPPFSFPRTISLHLFVCRSLSHFYVHTAVSPHFHMLKWRKKKFGKVQLLGVAGSSWIMLFVFLNPKGLVGLLSTFAHMSFKGKKRGRKKIGAGDCVRGRESTGR